MRLRLSKPIAELRDYVDRIWVFESDGALSSSDMRLFAPNGLAKLVVPFRGTLSGTMPGVDHTSSEHSITLIGACDRPATIEVHGAGPSGSLGIEFRPSKAHRFFACSQREIKNGIYALDEVAGPEWKRIEEALAEAPTVEAKVTALQAVLSDRIRPSGADAILDFCVNAIRARRGAISLSELEERTGYSARWLRALFLEKLGLGPKRFASVVRFDYSYTLFMNGASATTLRRQLHGLYYDESHFVKDFKRFTGLSPARLRVKENDFSRLFYE